MRDLLLQYIENSYSSTIIREKNSKYASLKAARDVSGYFPKEDTQMAN